MKQFFFILSLGLLALTFVAGAAEMAAQGLSGGLRIWMPAMEVWQVLSPDTLLAGEQAIAETSPTLWQLAQGLLQLPGWLLLGLPGSVMAIAFRDRETNEDLEHEEAMFLYDELARHAREEGMNDSAHGDDMMGHASERSELIEPADTAFADERVDPQQGPGAEKNAERPSAPKLDRDAD